MRLVLATGNAGKQRELAGLLARTGCEVVLQSAFGIEPADETGDTFEANALLKARHAAAGARLPALADDSGLEVDALDGRPGVYSARFAGAGASDAANLRKLIDELREVADDARTARYRCVIALVRAVDDPRPLLARGVWQGRIVREPRGAGGFGYDPVFVPSGESRTVAEMSIGEKNVVSHRALALRALLAQWQTL